MNAKSLRRFLGRLKCSIVDEIPYRAAHRSIPDHRVKFKKFLALLPPVPPPSEVAFEIHMLCGHRDCDMGIWASWSLMRFLDGRSKLFVHCDGSLTESDVAEWSRVINGVQVVSRQSADLMVRERIGHTRHLYSWRCSYPTSPQLVDSHLFGDNSVILLMDSDVIVFEKPRSLIEAVAMHGFTWCSDIRDSYSASPSVIERAVGIKIPSRFNSGLLVSPRFTQDNLMRLDSLLDQIHQSGLIDLNRYWACQTYYAIMSTFWNHANKLPQTYETTMGRTSRDATLRHYVGVPRVRYRYYTEGVSRLVAQLGDDCLVNNAAPI